MWFNYKQRHTIKVQIGCDGAGNITSISDAYGGSTCDKQLFINSGVVDKLEDGDAIMVDKGYLIQDALHGKQISLLRPPFLQSKQHLDQEERDECRTIARHSIVIENVNARVKTFKIIIVPESCSHTSADDQRDCSCVWNAVQLWPTKEKMNCTVVFSSVLNLSQYYWSYLGSIEIIKLSDISCHRFSKVLVILSVCTTLVFTWYTTKSQKVAKCLQQYTIAVALDASSCGLSSVWVTGAVGLVQHQKRHTL